MKSIRPTYYDYRKFKLILVEIKLEGGGGSKMYGKGTVEKIMSKSIHMKLSNYTIRLRANLYGSNSIYA